MEAAESKDSRPNVNIGKNIYIGALQVEFEIMKKAGTSSPRVNLECMGKNGITIRLWKYGQSGPAELF